MTSRCDSLFKLRLRLASRGVIRHKSVNILILTNANHGLFFTFAF